MSLAQSEAVEVTAPTKSARPRWVYHLLFFGISHLFILPVVLFGALYSYGWFEDTPVIADLSEGLKNPKVEVRLSTIEGLEGQGPSSSADLYAALFDQDRRVVEKAVLALGRLAKAHPAVLKDLSKMAGHERAHIRKSAAQAFRIAGTVSITSALPALKILADDEVGSVSKEAYATLLALAKELERSGKIPRLTEQRLIDDHWIAELEQVLAQRQGAR